MQTGYPYILATHVKPEKIDFDNCFYVSFNDHKEIFAKANPQKGDILLVNIGAGCGTPSIINVDFEFSFKNVAIVKRPKEILSKYLFYYLLSIREIVYNEITQGGAQPYLSLKMIKNLIFPLPPFNEQKRIVAKVDQLMVLCDELETKLTKSQNDCDELLSTIINSVENGKPENPSNKGSKSRNLFSLKTDKATGIPEPVKETFKSSSHKKPPPQRKKSQKPQARFKKPDVLRAYRKAIFRQYEVDELSLLRQVGQRLGIRRLSKPIQDELKSYIRTAIRRKILIRDGNGFIAGTPTIQYYDDDYLIKMLGSVTKKGWEYPRNYLVDKAAQYLGFGKPSNAFKDRMKSIFRMAIRQRIIYRNRSYVGKV